VRDYFEAKADKMLPACERNHQNALKVEAAWEKARAVAPDLGEMEMEGNEGVEHVFYDLLP
jgi:hypothetical protein